MENRKLIEVNNFIDCLKTQTYEHLFDDECYRRIGNLQKQFGHLLSDCVVWETPLSCPEKIVDCGIVQIQRTFCGKHYDLEMDYEACGNDEIIPCYGLDVTKATRTIDMYRAAKKVLPSRIPEHMIKIMWPQIKKIAEATSEAHGNVHTIGYMQGRNTDTKLKMYLQYLTPDAVIDVLRSIGWGGDLSALKAVLDKCVGYCKAERFMIDFGVGVQGVSPKMNVNITLKDKRRETVATFLRFLLNEGLCLQEKADDVMKFIDTVSRDFPHIQNGIMQFKLSFAGDRVMMAKVYLRQKTK